MVNIIEEDKQLWQSGERPFQYFMTAYPSSAAKIGVALGIPHAPNIIAVRSAYNGWWPPEYMSAIIHGREQYDAGLIELAQGRVQDHFFLYSFLRKKPAKKLRSYFTYMGMEP